MASGWYREVSTDYAAACGSLPPTPAHHGPPSPGTPHAPSTGTLVPETHHTAHVTGRVIGALAALVILGAIATAAVRYALRRRRGFAAL